MTKPNGVTLRTKQSEEGRPSSLSPTHAAEGYRHAVELELNSDNLGDPRVTILHTVSCQLSGIQSIQPGDILVADRSLAPADGDLVIVLINGERAVRLFSSEGGTEALNPNRERKSAAVVGKRPGIRILASVISVIPVRPD